MQIRSYKFDSNSKYHQNEIWSDTMQLGANIPHSVLFILAKLETSFQFSLLHDFDKWHYDWIG